MPRILITGSRDIALRETVAPALAAVWTQLGSHPGTVVVHGDARGADRIAGGVARDNPGRLVEEKHPAQWRKIVDGESVVDKRAGFIRNQKMVDAGADVCVAFFKHGSGNRGTTHAATAASNAGIPVIQVWEK